jgi:hypothetical protein
MVQNGIMRDRRETEKKYAVQNLMTRPFKQDEIMVVWQGLIMRINNKSDTNRVPSQKKRASYYICTINNCPYTMKDPIPLPLHYEGSYSSPSPP